MQPPSEWPKSAARSEPTASSTARTSSIRCSSVGRRSSGTWSERPVPRLSKRISRENDASRCKKWVKGGYIHMYSTFDTQPGT